MGLVACCSWVLHSSGHCEICWCVLQVANINIPPVRVKTREQLEKRQMEVLALKRRAAQHSPRLGGKGDSSSSEDTSDEAFLARHQPGWEEEHRRNYAPAAGACAPAPSAC